jgi:hypothetical protein
MTDNWVSTIALTSIYPRYPYGMTEVLGVHNDFDDFDDCDVCDVHDCAINDGDSQDVLEVLQSALSVLFVIRLELSIGILH